jgi:WD40 repeat protein
VDTGETRASVRIEDYISSLAYSPDGATLVAASESVYLLSPTDASVRKRLPIEVEEYSPNVRGLTYLPDGSRLFGRHGGQPFLLDLEKGECVPLGGSGYNDTGHSCCLRPDGKEVVLSNQYWRLRFWSLPEGRLCKAPRWFEEQERSQELVTAPAWSPDSRLFAAVVKLDEETYRLRLWDVAKGTVRCDWPAVYSGKATFAPDGRTLVASKADTLAAYDVAGGELAELVRIGISSLAFSPDGKLLATGHDNSIRLWPVEVLRSS